MASMAAFVKLSDGRSVAFRELGCAPERATRTLFVIHGLGSSRIAAIPGVREDLLQEFGVRLVAIDRPGYGKSDPPPPDQTLRTSVLEIEQIIDKLALGDKVWLLGYSAGGAYCWAAARYIPHRIHAIALWAPLGNYWWEGISVAERAVMFSSLSASSRRMLPYMRYLPSFLVSLYARHVLARRAGRKWVEHCKATLSIPDQKHLQQYESTGLLLEDNLESITFNRGIGIAKDLELLTSDWGFQLEDVANSFKGRVHIWQGTDDRLVPLALQKWIKATIPNVVQLHELPGEGHLSWFCFNDQSHRTVFETLFSAADQA